ncbi:MAG: T9SS type A sorting domain-containing protein, partial [candidate division WOR-3 bacterium]|nr:T9SS type A sorting domain-containing protein [candidate division WOR-3 bacterium]
SDALFTILPTGLEETQVIIDQPLKLEINPNPFKTQTTIRLNRPTDKTLTVKIYRPSGELVKTLTHNQKQSNIYWDGKDEQGKLLPSGIYTCHLETEGMRIIEKVILTR